MVEMLEKSFQTVCKELSKFFFPHIFIRLFVIIVENASFVSIQSFVSGNLREMKKIVENANQIK